VNEASAESLDLFPRHEVGLHRLRRLRAGELPSAEAAQVQAHTASCAACQGRLAQLESEEAARHLGVKVATLYAYVSRGLLVSHAVPGSRRRRFAREDLDRLAGRGRPARAVR